jgi:WXG100 family type VII secretion target
MTDILITPEKLEDVAGKFETAKTDIETLMATLKSALFILDTQWDGVAQTSFYTKCDTVLFPNTRNYADMLQEIATELRCIATTFRDLDATVIGGGGGGSGAGGGGGHHHVK